MRGTISVDFAGDRKELASYIAEHSSKFPRGLTDGGPRNSRVEEKFNGHPNLFTVFHTKAEMLQAQQAFAGLDWEEDFQLIRQYDAYKKRA